MRREACATGANILANRCNLRPEKSKSGKKFGCALVKGAPEVKALFARLELEAEAKLKLARRSSVVVQKKVTKTRTGRILVSHLKEVDVT